MKKIPFVVHKSVTDNNKYHVTYHGKTTSHPTLSAARKYASKFSNKMNYHDAYENVKTLNTIVKKRPQRRRTPTGWGALYQPQPLFKPFRF